MSETAITDNIRYLSRSRTNVMRIAACLYVPGLQYVELCLIEQDVSLDDSAPEILDVDLDVHMQAVKKLDISVAEFDQILAHAKDQVLSILTLEKTMRGVA